VSDTKLSKFPINAELAAGDQIHLAVRKVYDVDGRLLEFKPVSILVIKTERATK
jgi:hypothetical protein